MSIDFVFHFQTMPRKLLKFLNRLFGRILIPAAAILKSFFLQKSEKRSILILKLVGLGDMALIAPVLHLMRRSLPEYRITALVTPITQAVVIGNADVDEVIVYDVLGKDSGFTGFLRLIRNLRQRRFSTYVDFEHHFNMSAVLGVAAGIPFRTGLSHPDHDRSALFTNPVDYAERTHMTRLYYSLYEKVCMHANLPVSPYDAIFEYRLPADAESVQAVDEWMKKNVTKKLIGIHPGSGAHTHRRWPEERFVALIERLLGTGKYQIVLTGGREEQDLVERIRSRFDPSLVLKQEKMTLFFALLKRMSLLITNDTGPVHLGPWSGTRTIGLFGPETPEKYGTLHPGSFSFYGRVECSPCIQVHRDFIPPCTNPVVSKCLKEISVDAVFEKALELTEK